MNKNFDKKPFRPKPMTGYTPKEKEGLIYGMRPILEALKNGADIDSLFVQQGLKGELFTEVMSLVKEKNIQVKRVPVEKLNRLTSQNHQGVAAFISPVKIHRTEEIIEELIALQTPVSLLMLDRVSDVRNFGAICRTAEAMGVQAVIIPEGGSAPVNEDAMRTSTGAILNLKICREKNLAHTLDLLQEKGFTAYTVSEKADKSIFETTFEPLSVLIMGNEETGISKEILHHADDSFRIPMTGNTESLNVSVATGMALLEMLRQRNH